MLRNAFIHIVQAAFEAAHLHPLWVGLGILAAALIAVLLRRSLRKAFATGLAWYRPFAEHLFQIACGLLFFVLFLDFVDESLAPTSDAESLAALAATLLVLALGAQYGQHLFARLKKLGPLELFEREATELIEHLKEILDRLDVEIVHALGTPLSPAAEDTYQNANALIRHVEFSGTAPTSEASKRRFGDLLFKFAQLALQREDWWVARRTLERLRNLLGPDFEGLKVAYNLGMAHLQCSAPGAEGDEMRREALACFAEAAKRDPFDSDSFFWLAYVQDELGMLDLAIANNRKVLERRHGYAPAKYNIVISRIKKGEMDQALADLLAIRWQDEAGLETLHQATADGELRPLLTHPIYGSQARWWLDFHLDPTRFPG